MFYKEDTTAETYTPLGLYLQKEGCWKLWCTQPPLVLDLERLRSPRPNFGYDLSYVTEPADKGALYD